METTADIDERRKCDSCCKTIRDAQDLLVSARSLARAPSFATGAEASNILQGLVNGTETILRLLELGSSERIMSIMTWEKTLAYIETIRSLTGTCVIEDNETSNALGIVVELAKSVAYHFIDYTYLSVELEFNIGFDVLPGFLDHWLLTPKPYLQLCAQKDEIVKLANSAYARKLTTAYDDWERFRVTLADCDVDLQSLADERLDIPAGPELVRIRKFYDILVPSFVFILAYGRHMQSKVEDMPSEDAGDICCWLC